MKRNSGFTLIELLVVIAIIGILSTIVLSQLTIAKRKSQDAKRLTDAQAVVTALTLYIDSHGTFPCVTYYNSTGAGFMSFLVSDGLLPAEPVDPVNTIGLFYEFWTMTSYPGGPCGQYGVFGYFMDRQQAVCVTGKGYHAAPWENHCHAVVPGPIPCSDPYQEIAPIPPDCDAMRP